MPFIGNQPALSYTSFAKQDFTTSATTSYTLDHPVTNENEIALFINFVRQEPTTAYTATNTTLTLTSATSASDDMYCVFLGKAVQTVNPPSGSVGLSQLSATGTKDATTFLRGDNTFASAGGDNTPSFYAYNTSNQYISNGTWTKVNFGTEVFDTDNNFDNSLMRFTPTTAGKYLCSFTVESSWGGSVGGNQMYNKFYKNGSSIEGIVRRMAFFDYYDNGSLDLIMTQSQSVIIDFNGSSDYLEVFHLSSATSPYLEAGSNFGAFKLIGV